MRAFLSNLVVLAPQAVLEKFCDWSAKNGCCKVIPKGVHL